MKRKSVVNSVQTQAIKAIITISLLFPVLLISSYTANALDITGGATVDLDTSGINSGDPINFTSGGGTLNVNTNLSATTASSTLTVATSTSGTVTGTEDFMFGDTYPFTVATTILQAGSALTVMNPGDNNLGDLTAADFNINTTIGYSFKLPQEIMLTPSYSLGYTLYHDPEYTETGAGVQNNNFASFTSNSLLQDLGVRLGRLFRHSENLAFLPEVWGGWEVEYLNTGGNRNSTTSAALFSNTYSTSMNGMATNRGYWGGGLTALINDNISVFGRYDQKIWDSGFNVGFSAGIKIIF